MVVSRNIRITFSLKNEGENEKISLGPRLKLLLIAVDERKRCESRAEKSGKNRLILGWEIHRFLCPSPRNMLTLYCRY